MYKCIIFFKIKLKTMPQKKILPEHQLVSSYSFLYTYVFIGFILETTEAPTHRIVPACLPTPNPDSNDFEYSFRQDILNLVETCNIHKHSATCYKYSKDTTGAVKACRMRMPRALVKSSNIDISTGQIALRQSHP